MLRIENNVWIGSSADEACADLAGSGVTAILNTAFDLAPTRGWRAGIEYAHVGLIDGPGNPPSLYAAAVLALAGIIKTRSCMVCCHNGGRSLAVIVMLFNARVRYRWDEWLDRLSERTDYPLPRPHDAHRAAFELMDWRSLSRLVG